MCTHLHWCMSMCMHTLVRAKAARLSYFQVHVSPEGINCCELSDSSAVFVQPLMQRRRRRSGDKWEVVFQSVFICLCPISVCITLALSFSQHLLPLPFCTYVCVSVTGMQQALVGYSGMSFQARLSLCKKKQQTVDLSSSSTYSVCCKYQNQQHPSKFTKT